MRINIIHRPTLTFAEYFLCSWKYVYLSFALPLQNKHYHIPFCTEARKVDKPAHIYTMVVESEPEINKFL